MWWIQIHWKNVGKKVEKSFIFLLIFLQKISEQNHFFEEDESFLIGKFDGKLEKVLLMDEKGQVFE